jgi:hypothetical protein
VLRLREDEPQRFAGLMLGASLARTMVETHDDDWFNNPRATDQLRSESNMPPNTRTETNAVQQGADDLLAALKSALG